MPSTCRTMGERVRLTTFSLSSNADIWWNGVRHTQDVSKMLWETFTSRFLLRYFSRTEREAIEREFLFIEQGDRSVYQYFAVFLDSHSTLSLMQLTRSVKL